MITLTEEWLNGFMVGMFTTLIITALCMYYGYLCIQAGKKLRGDANG